MAWLQKRCPRPGTSMGAGGSGRPGVGVVALCGNHAGGEGSRRRGAVRGEFGGRRPHMSRVNGSLVGWSGPAR
jgi:hypothetical protein